jgi:hypothetical protein
MLREIDALLRGEGRHRVGELAAPWVWFGAVLVVCCCGYGLAMGSFAGRPLQALYSAIKVPLLLGGASAVCLPNFYAVNAVLGLGADFKAAWRGLVVAQTTLAVSLLALAPLTLVVYASGAGYHLATLSNGIAFAASTFAGQLALRRHYAPLIARDPRHRSARRGWAILYVLVAIQLAWMLRPFIGDPALPSRFLRDEPWSNAYVIVARTVWRLFVGP